MAVKAKLIRLDIRTTADPHLVRRDLARIARKGDLGPGRTVWVCRTMTEAHLRMCDTHGTFPTVRPDTGPTGPRLRKCLGHPGLTAHYYTIEEGLDPDKVRRAMATVGWMHFCGNPRPGRVIAIHESRIDNARQAALRTWGQLETAA